MPDELQVPPCEIKSACLEFDVLDLDLTIAVVSHSYPAILCWAIVWLLSLQERILSVQGKENLKTMKRPLASDIFLLMETNTFITSQ